MAERYNQEEVFTYWTQQAIKFGQSPSASWSDQMVIEKEIREIVKYLNDGDKVLDIGCSNGYSTLQIARQKQINIRGLDYIPEMIREARLRLESAKKELGGNVEFDVGDITNLKEKDESYDRIIVIRVLINLGNWHRQLAGLQECIRVLKTGGMLLLSEATLQGWEKLNKFRREWGLTDIPMPPFNQYIDQEKIIKASSQNLQIIQVVDFCSTYYVGTRLLKPLLIKALGAKIDVADPLMEWNQWFAQLPSWGDYGTQKLFIFKKT
jgi:ubiquinone/menaquinone biosynthesis C-methylase UbiE